MTVPALRYLLHPVLQSQARGEEWTEAGALTDIPIGEPKRTVLQIIERDGWSERLVEKAVWILRHPDDKLNIQSAVCPHLGCIINWKAESKNFNCACHQSHFDLAGTLLSGPSPRPMDTLDYKLEAGLLYVKYQNFKQGISGKEVLS